MRTAIIQKQGNRIASENSFLAAIGFANIGYTIKEIEEKDLQICMLDNPTAVAVGGTRFIRTAFTHLGVSQPPVHNPHIHLPDYVGRDMCEAKFREIRELTNFPFFIKPSDHYKLFTGFVVNSQQDLSRINIDYDTNLILSECVEFVSEYRCFVLNGHIVDMRKYKGDFSVFPNLSIIENAVRDYKQQPAAYAIDFGVTRDGRTLLVEMNDGFALGAYGLDKTLYCKILQTRWDEILKPYS